LKIAAPSVEVVGVGAIAGRTVAVSLLVVVAEPVVVCPEDGVEDVPPLVSEDCSCLFPPPQPIIAA
jgi:hypothetical protein